MVMMIAVGTAAIATFGFKGAKDAKLPITVGPQTGGGLLREINEWMVFVV